MRLNSQNLKQNRQNRHHSKDLGLLRQLESLEARDNYLTSLPPSLALLQSLRVLDLGNNHLHRQAEYSDFLLP